MVAALARKLTIAPLVLRELLRPHTVGGLLAPDGLVMPPLDRPGRLYVAVSHAVLQFETLKLPARVDPRRFQAAARLEAERLHRILHPETRAGAFSLWPRGGGEVLAAALPAELVRTLAQTPSPAILSGAFPAWTALWAVVRARGLAEEGAVFVRAPWGFEGLWFREGRPAGVVPSGAGAGEVFLRHFAGERTELEGDPQEVLLEGARLVPEVLRPEEVPCFEPFPLRLRPRVNARLLYLWLLPLVVWGASLRVEQLREEVSLRAREVRAALREVQAKYEEIEAARKRLEEEKKLAEAIKPFLPEERPPLLRALAILAEKLPETAWIRRLEFRAPDQLRIWGEGENALAILETLSAQPLFQEVRFLSTVTKNPRTGREAFSMLLKLTPEAQALGEAPLIEP